MKRKFPGRTGLLLFAVLLGSGFFFSCSRNEPRIPFGFIELTYYPGAQERFSFFVVAEDDDGLENLSELRLVNDRDGLEWALTAEDWVHHEESGRHWIGSRGIAMAGGEALPRGQYRAMLLNKGGEKTEMSITFDAPASPRYPYPSFRITEGRYTINSQYPEHSFVAYDQQGNATRIVPLPDTQGNIADLNIPGSARLLAVWAQDSEYRTSALTEAAPFR